MKHFSVALQAQQKTGNEIVWVMSKCTFQNLWAVYLPSCGPSCFFPGCPFVPPHRVAMKASPPPGFQESQLPLCLWCLPTLQMYNRPIICQAMMLTRNTPTNKELSHPWGIPEGWQVLYSGDRRAGISPAWRHWVRLWALADSGSAPSGDCFFPVGRSRRRGSAQCVVDSQFCFAKGNLRTCYSAVKTLISYPCSSKHPGSPN